MSSCRVVHVFSCAPKFVIQIQAKKKHTGKAAVEPYRPTHINAVEKPCHVKFAKRTEFTKVCTKHFPKGSLLTTVLYRMHDGEGLPRLAGIPKRLPKLRR